MDDLIRLTRNGELTLPNAIRRALDIRAGDYVQLKLIGHSVVLTPKKVLDKNQAYYWSDEWQAAEKAADADIAAGRMKKFDNVEDLIRELNS